MTDSEVQTGSLTVSVIDRVEDLAALVEPWRALHAACAPANSFLSFDWMQSWAQRFCQGQRRLHVVTVRKDGGVVAIAPWCRVVAAGAFGLSSVEFLGTAVAAADHLDVLAEPAVVPEVAACLLGHFFGPGAPRWHRLDLRGFAADSAFLFQFSRELDRARCVFEIGAGSYCPTLALQGGGEEGLASHLSRRRKRLRYEISVLARQGAVEHRTHRSGEREAPEAAERLLALYRARWGAQVEELIDFPRTLVAETGERGRVEIDLLDVAGTSVAGLLHLRSGDSIYLHLMAVDRTLDPRLSVGNLILGLALERAAKEGLRSYDFLRGSEDYKFRWADGAAQDLDLLVHRRSPRAWLALAYGRLRELAKLAVR